MNKAQRWALKQARIGGINSLERMIGIWSRMGRSSVPGRTGKGIEVAIGRGINSGSVYRIKSLTRIHSKPPSGYAKPHVNGPIGSKRMA